MKLTSRMLYHTSFKIFLYFWTVTILMVVGSNIVVHFFGFAPDKHLSNQSSSQLRGSGDRLLREVVSDAINYNRQEVMDGLNNMPHWMTERFYVIDEDGKELLGRDVPEEVETLLLSLSEEHPLAFQDRGNTNYYGRLFRLADGTSLRLFVFTQNESALAWQLFFSSFWHILAVNIVISGAACYYLARFIMRDVQTLKEATRRVANGQWDISISKEFGNRSDEMAELGKAFDEMVNKLQRSMLEQKRLIKDVSHELRSPLARLQVALALAQQKANTEVEEELQRIKEAADYLNDLIGDILSLPITEQDGWELNDTMEICSLITALLESSRDEIADKQIELEVVDNLHEALIQTRGKALVGVFDNILRNALRYTENNSRIQIRLTQMPGGLAQVIFNDSGPGVDEKHLDNIFEPFFRTDEARDRKSGGHGLGLAIAKRTVLLHGGTIKAMNNPDSGLSIVITLPQIETV